MISEIFRKETGIDGHGPNFRPPVPRPADYEEPPWPSRLEMFSQNFVLSQWFGPLAKLLAALAVCVLVATTRGLDPWDWALAAVWLMQMAVWAMATHGMPPRFAIPAIVPMALLGGGLLARLGTVQANPFRKGAARPSYGPWGMMPAVTAFLATVALNLLVCYGIYNVAGAPPIGNSPGSPPLALHGVSGADVATYGVPWRQATELRPGSRLLLVGDAKAFYFPPGTVYATAFNAQLLDEMLQAGLSPPQIIAALRDEGVTHLWFDWYELQRLGETYGFPASLSAELLARARTGEPPSLPIVRELEDAGMTRVGQIELSLPTSAPTSAPASGPADSPAPSPADPSSQPTTGPARWPVVTIYALPGAPAPAPPKEPPSP